MYIRKVHTKKGTSSMLFNIPIPYAKALDIKVGDYLTVDAECDRIIIRKVDFDIEVSKEEEKKDDGT